MLDTSTSSVAAALATARQTSGPMPLTPRRRDLALAGVQAGATGSLQPARIFSNGQRAADRAKWNEQANPSFYEKAVGGVVRSNLLTGHWKGPFTSAKGTSAPIESLVKLSATPTNVTGTYEWQMPKPTNKGKITAGTITQQTASVAGTQPGEPAASAKPASGVKVDFDWTEGTSKGKGVWSSVNEQTLDGSWGIGASNSDGSWKLKKA